MILLPLLPLPASFALSRDEDAYLNRSVDEMGLLHLSTLSPYVYHMGNQLDEYTLAEIHRQDLDRIIQQSLSEQNENVSVKIKSVKRRGLQILESLSRWAFFRRTIQRFYNFLFEFYSQKK